MDKDALYREFRILYEKALDDGRKIDYPYVYETDIRGLEQDSKEQKDAARDALSTLENNEFILQLWDRFVAKEPRYRDTVLFETAHWAASAIVIAAKVYLNPDLKADLGYESSKWTKGTSQWWVISPAAPEGKILTSSQHTSYLPDRVFPDVFSLYLKDVAGEDKEACLALAESVANGDELKLQVLKEYGKFKNCIGFLKGDELIGIISEGSYYYKSIKRNLKKLYAIVEGVMPVKGRSVKNMRVDVYVGFQKQQFVTAK